MFERKIWDKFTEFTFLKFGNLPSETCESLQHVINQESHVYSQNLRKIYLVHFLKLWKFQNFKKVYWVNKFISNFWLKHVITSAN